MFREIKQTLTSLEIQGSETKSALQNLDQAFGSWKPTVDSAVEELRVCGPPSPESSTHRLPRRRRHLHQRDLLRRHPCHLPPRSEADADREPWPWTAVDYLRCCQHHQAAAVSWAMAGPGQMATVFLSNIGAATWVWLPHFCPLRPRLRSRSHLRIMPRTIAQKDFSLRVLIVCVLIVFPKSISLLSMARTRTIGACAVSTILRCVKPIHNNGCGSPQFISLDEQRRGCVPRAPTLCIRLRKLFLLNHNRLVLLFDH